MESLTQLAAELLEQARTSSSGRGAKSVYGGREHALRQTLMAIKAGEGLPEHPNPGEATLQMLEGIALLKTASEAVELRAGDFAVIPQELHSLDVIEDAVFLLTVALRATHEESQDERAR